MPLEVHQFSCLEDNYGFLARDAATGKVACIDTPDAETILGELDRLGWSLDVILNTHWHGDHVGGNERLRARTGAMVVAPAEVEQASTVDRVVGDGDIVYVGQTRLSVLDTGGHTREHVSYYAADDGLAFVGDTLFALGCGRLFEGPPDQMWTSLVRLAALPDTTLVCCAHEYTEANARFAQTVDKGPALAARVATVVKRRRRGEPTVPTTIGAERATNPFLRAPYLYPDLDEVAAFAKVRAAKDNFRG